MQAICNCEKWKCEVFNTYYYLMQDFVLQQLCHGGGILFPENIVLQIRILEKEIEILLKSIQYLNRITNNQNESLRV